MFQGIDIGRLSNSHCLKQFNHHRNIFQIRKEIINDWKQDPVKEQDT